MTTVADDDNMKFSSSQINWYVSTEVKVFENKKNENNGMLTLLRCEREEKADKCW